MYSQLQKVHSIALSLYMAMFILHGPTACKDVDNLSWSLTRWNRNYRTMGFVECIEQRTRPQQITPNKQVRRDWELTWIFTYIIWPLISGYV